MDDFETGVYYRDMIQEFLGLIQQGPPPFFPGKSTLSFLSHHHPGFQERMEVPAQEPDLGCGRKGALYDQEAQVLFGLEPEIDLF